MPTVHWDTERYESPPWGGGRGQLCVEVEGADAGWAERFNEMAGRHYTRGDTRGGLWGLVCYHQVEGNITVDELSEGHEEEIRAHLKELCEMATPHRN